MMVSGMLAVEPAVDQCTVRGQHVDHKQQISVTVHLRCITTVAASAGGLATTRRAFSNRTWMCSLSF